MAVEIVEYIRVDEITEHLQSAARRTEPAALFLVPSSGDRQILRETLQGDTSFGSGEPRVLRWEDLHRELLTALPADIRPETARQIDPPDHWLILKHILAEFMELEPAVQNALPGIRRGGFLWTVGASIRELLRENVSPADLAHSLGCEGETTCEECPEKGTPAGVLCRLFHMYTAYLAEHGLADSARRAADGLALLKTFPDRFSKWLGSRRLLLAGFMSFTRSQADLLKELAALGGDIALFRPSSGLDYPLNIDAGISVNAKASERSTPIPVLEVAAGDHRLELETIARNLVLWSEGRGELHDTLPDLRFPGWENTGLVVDQERLAMAEEVFERYCIPYTVSEGLTVADTPVWRTASATWETYANGYPFERTAHLLCEPFLSPGGAIPAGPGSGYPEGFEAWSGFLQRSNRPELLESFVRLDTFAREVEKGLTPPDLLKSLRRMAGPSTASQWSVNLSRFVLNDLSLDEQARRLAAGTGELDEKLLLIEELQKDIGPAGTTILKGAEAMAFLSAWARRSSIWQAPEISGSLHIYPGQPPVLAQHEIWILTGATADAWPGPLSESPLLDDSRRDNMHADGSLGLAPTSLPGMREQRRQKEALFRRLLACAGKLCLVSRPVQDASGRPLISTPFLESAVRGGKPWAVKAAGETLIARRMKDILPRDNEPKIAKVEIRENDPPRIPHRLAELPPPTPAPSPELAVRLSDLDTWRECPFRFYARAVLGLYPERRPGYDRARAGVAVHRLWNLAWEACISDSGQKLARIAMDMMPGILKECYPELLEKSGPLARHAIRLEKQIQALAETQQAIEDAGLRRRRVDQLREQSVSLELDGVTFKGRYDRVDMLDDGRLLLVDYKSGGSEKYRNSLQLPAYGLATAGDTGTGIAGYAYLCLNDAWFSGRFAPDLHEMFQVSSRARGTLQSSLDAAEKTLKDIAAAWKTGEFKPDHSDRNLCAGCEYRALCRRDETPGGTVDDE